ncbi:MAG TPA: phage major tail tube protein [Candidatus Sulfotelmatobacter sp.]|jgi:P2 family phage contractile tail tube protein|nr:phage major tail tube protein [Candidatus Sulfotelmatobacter sp.]
MALPRVLKNYTLYIDGRSYAGLIEELTLPKLSLKTEEYQAAGMLGPIDLDMGMDGMKLEFTLAEFNPDILASWGIADVSGINARFLGAAVAADGTGTDAVEISVRGRWKTLDPGSVKGKDLAKMKVEMPLTYYRYNRNSTTLIEVDFINGKMNVNGTSLTDAVLTALGINT